MSAHKWEFSSRLRRNAFGWRSQVPMKRIQEAVSEIKKISRKDPELAAEGSVLFLEKISLALAHVDSSSGAISGAVNNAIEILAPIISKVNVPEKKRHQWLSRIWAAIEEDNIPYIEYLEEFFGELCATPEIASYWADYFIDLVKHIWSPEVTGFNYYKGTIPCLSALLFAKRYDELLALTDRAPHKMWHYRKFGVNALIAAGKLKEALQYAENSDGLNCPYGQISQKCEEILLLMGLEHEAYNRYALSANQSMTHLATFRALVKKYPHKNPENILQDLIKSQPGIEGKWFSAAKNAKFYDLAIELVSKSPTDPRTLTRAAKEFAAKKPDFAIASGMASLRWISTGYGYEITSAEVLDAFHAVMEAANAAGINTLEMKTKIKKLISYESESNNQFVKSVLMHYLNDK